MRVHVWFSMRASYSTFIACTRYGFNKACFTLVCSVYATNTFGLDCLVFVIVTMGCSFYGEG